MAKSMGLGRKPPIAEKAPPVNKRSQDVEVN